MSVRQRSRRLVCNPSLLGRSGRAVLLAALVGLPACANPPWATKTTQHANAGPLPSGDDPNAPPPAPFQELEKQRIHEVQPWVERASSTYEIDPNLIHAVIWVESRHQPRAKSPAGARGLMQLMPATASAMARELGRPIARVYDPAFNVEAGSLYLSRLLEKYEGDETLALAAYNAGPGNVDKWLKGDGLPPVSLEYVGLVMEARRRFVALGGEWSQPLDEGPTRIATADRPAPRPEPSVPEPPPPAKEEVPVQRVANPLAPSPDVYKPTPPLEPPLADTPYPPLEEPPRARASTSRPRRPAPEPDARARERAADLPAPPRGLPSVLD
jgi:hypothetical protein